MVRDLSEKGPIGEYRSDNRLRWQKLVAQTGATQNEER
jgi:hypothetical protein